MVTDEVYTCQSFDAKRFIKAYPRYEGGQRVCTFGMHTILAERMLFQHTRACHMFSFNPLEQDVQVP